MADEQSIKLNADEIRVETDPEKLGEMMSRLMSDRDFRERFEADPVSELRTYGITVPESARDKITPESIDATISSMTEGGDPARFEALSVLVGVRVGTRPGTRPGVSVGVRVATGTSTFGVAQRPEEMSIDEIEEK